MCYVANLFGFGGFLLWVIVLDYAMLGFWVCLFTLYVFGFSCGLGFACWGLHGTVA